MFVSIVDNKKKRIHCLEVAELKIKFDENDRPIQILFKKERNEEKYSTKAVEGFKVFVNGRDIRTRSKGRTGSEEV